MTSPGRAARDRRSSAVNATVARGTKENRTQMGHASPSPPVATSRPPQIAAAAVVLAITVFVFDSVSPVEVTAGVLYVIVVLLAVRVCLPRGVVIVAAGCIALTVTSHFLSPGDHWDSIALANRFLAILAIVVTTFVALKNQSAQMALQRAEFDRVARLMTLAQLTASIAHEVRQPLTAVVTNGDACLRWLDSQPHDLDEARQAAREMIKDGNRINEVVQRIRALIKGTPPRKESLNINETILEAIALARSEVQQNGVSLRTQLSSDLPRVLGDRIQLQQVILNLLTNAIDAMSQLDQRQRKSLVSSRIDESNTVLVAVQDSGTGLDSDSLNRIFEAFHTTKPDGMGMGLVISRSIIMAHGGRLWATNNQPQGAIFQFTLPAARDEDAPASPLQVADRDQNAGPTGPSWRQSGRIWFVGEAPLF
jgi:signal transduction histidine kinase